MALHNEVVQMSKKEIFPGEAAVEDLERPIAYSYVRFSTKKQELGDSLRRQVEAAQRYAKEHNLQLSQRTFRDLGVSGFKQRNVKQGALAAFIGAVKSGLIAPGIFSPWGFDVFENLARVVYPAIEVNIKAELDALPTSEAAFIDLKTGNTAVAKFLGSTSHTTTAEAVDKACSFSEEDARRLETLETALLEKSPKERAQTLRDQARRLDNLLQTMSQAAQVASDAEVERHSAIDRELAACEEAEAVAATALRGDSKLMAGRVPAPDD